MKISLFMLLFIIACNKAYALPQDWPCFGIEVEKYKTIRTSNGTFEYAYKGEKEGYVVNINLTGFSDFPTLFANCGNIGCFGTITETASGKTENLNFFCEEYNDDYTKVICNIALGEEIIFDEKSNKNYVANYCSNNTKKTLRFNANDCNKCHCNIYWYDGNKKRTQKNYACRKEENKAHCFTYYGYEAWRNFKHKDDDFQNCVDLDF